MHRILRKVAEGKVFEDPQFAARGNLMTVHDPRIGDIVVPAPLPRMSRTPPRIVSTGPSLGNATYDILHDMLGLTQAEIAVLAERGVV